LAIAPSSDWCRIRIESGYRRAIAPIKHYNTRKERDIAATAEDGAAGELISHQAQPVSNRESLWVPQEINPPWDPRITDPEQDCGDGCKI
jgi:hypothetical protein